MSNAFEPVTPVLQENNPDMTTKPAPTIVLVHGAFADAGSWTGVIAELQNHGIRGPSTPPLRLALGRDPARWPVTGAAP